VIRQRASVWLGAIALGFLLLRPSLPGRAQTQPASSAPSSTARPVGTVKAVNGDVITVTTDAGKEINVQVQSYTRILHPAPGQKDLKDAPSLPLAELQPGDRMIIRGNLANDGKSIIASSLLVMKKADIQQRQEQEREDWQKRGVGGLVKAVDPASGRVSLQSGAPGANKTINVQVSKGTIIRRYAPESVKFQDAKPATLDQIKPGDQLRARGTLSADGNELSAEEIVSGTFRNIAGTIAAVDPGSSTINVNDIFSKKPVGVKVTPDSQLRKLPPMLAQRIAARLKGAAPEANGNNQSAPSGADQNHAEGPRRGTADLQQMLSRLPAVSLTDLQKGDAVMLVTMQGGSGSALNAVTMLTGVEPILTASPNEGAAILLTPWTLGSQAGEAAAQ